MAALKAAYVVLLSVPHTAVPSALHRNIWPLDPPDGTCLFPDVVGCTYLFAPSAIPASLSSIAWVILSSTVLFACVWFWLVSTSAAVRYPESLVNWDSFVGMSVIWLFVWVCAAGGNVDGLLPISVQLYAGFADAFAHAATSDAGMEVGKSVICALL